MINIIAAVGKNLELGKDNKMIWYLPGDLKYFKEMTTDKTIVMGRKTFESIGSALDNRKNIVLTSKELDDDNIIIVYDYKDVFDLDDDLFIIGGEAIYNMFLPYADNIYLTEIDKTCDSADTYFPSFDKDLYDKEMLGKESYNDINYSFVRYRKK